MHELEASVKSAIAPERQASRERQKARRIFLLLVAICIVVRLIQWFSYQPVVAPDTHTYKRFADQIAQWDFSAYDGTRTPVYPLLMLLAKKNAHRLWAIQSILGIATSVLLFLLVFRYSRSAKAGLFAGLIYTLSLNLLYFEAALLTETVSTFLLTLSLVLFSVVLEGKRKTAAAIGLGLTAGIVALTHPLFAFSGVLFGLCTFVFSDRERVRLSSTVTLLALVPLLSWMVLNKWTLGFFTLTTYTGFNLTNHSGGFMELAPPSPIRDIYLEYREIKRAETGRHSMTIYLAREEIQRRTGLSTPELSAELTRMSIELFRQYPLRYLRSVAEQWLGFWAVPNYWQLDHVKSPSMRGLVTTIWKYEHWILRVVNVLFVLACVFLLVRSLQRSKANPSVKLFSTVALLVLTTSLVQALFEYGNTRYSIPTQVLVGCTVLVFLHDLRVDYRLRYMSREA